MSVFRIPGPEGGDPNHPDASMGRDRPEEWVRYNAAGEPFHTYSDPDMAPAQARADEALWRLDHPQEA